jgi:hypothetical protein
VPLPTTATAPLPFPSAPLASTSGAATMPAQPTAPPAAVYTPEEVTGVLNDLVTAVQGIRLFLTSSYGPPQPPPPTAATGPPALPWHSPLSAASTAFAGPLQPQLQPSSTPPQWPQWLTPTLAAPPAPFAPMQQTLPLQSPPLLSTGPAPTTPGGVPIQQVRFPPSPSPLLAWLSESSPQPVYTTAGEQPAPTLQYSDTSGSAGPYAGRAPPSSLLRTTESPGQGGHTPTPPRFTKIDFATYDGTEDPLN